MTLENMIVQCPKSYGIRTSDSRHTNLSIMQFEMLIFKIGLVIKENVCFAFLYVLSTYHVLLNGTAIYIETQYS